MSVRIKISYERPEELWKVLHLLRPVIQSTRMPEGKKGKYKRAYVALLPDETEVGDADRRETGSE